MAVGIRLAGPQEIEVRSVEDIDRLGTLFRGFGHPNPGNVAASRGVIGNNRAQGKPLRAAAAPVKASSGSKKGWWKLLNMLVNQVPEEEAGLWIACHAPATGSRLMGEGAARVRDASLRLMGLIRTGRSDAGRGNRIQLRALTAVRSWSLCCARRLDPPSLAENESDNVVATIKEFVEFWLENSVHADEPLGPRRGRADIQELVDRLVRFAEGQGYSKPQIEAEIGDLHKYIRASIDQQNIDETARLKKEPK